MSLFITSLNSGSNGNCYYVGNHSEAVLVDAGISCREIETRMANLNLPTKKYPDERECAVKLAESVSHIRDVDESLATDPELKTKLRDSQADLLQAAGYDRAAYVKWVDDGETVATN